MKEQIIQIPDTLEIKEIKDGKIILVEKEKKLTYEDIAKELFYNKSGFYITADAKIHSNLLFGITSYEDATNCTSTKQAEKLLAINKLMNVAKYLNGDWQPDWDEVAEYKYYIHIDEGDVKVDCVNNLNCLDVYFKSEEFAEKAIEILGEETIRLALYTNY